MIDLSLLADGGIGWLDASGPASHLVLSTRVRLARNLRARTFGVRTSAESEDILDRWSPPLPIPPGWPARRFSP
jgi:protein-arginine kinase